MQISAQCFIINQVFVGSVMSARAEFLWWGESSQGSCKSGHCCDLQRTLVAALNPPAVKMQSSFEKNPSVLQQGFCFTVYLALGNLQNTHEGAASRSVLWMTHINKAGPAAWDGRWQPCSRAAFVLNLPGVQCFKTLDSSKCTCLFQNSVISASACTAQLTFNNPLILDQKYRTRENFKALGKKL